MPDHWVIELGADWPWGIAPYGQIGKHLKPLIAKYPFTQVQIHWKHFCAAAKKEVALDPEKARYWTPAKFAQYFETWAPPTRSPIFTPNQPVSKTVMETVSQRTRLIQVPVDDPRPAA